MYVDDFLQNCKFYIRIAERYESIFIPANLSHDDDYVSIFRNVENEREASLFEVVRHADITATEDKENGTGKFYFSMLSIAIFLSLRVHSYFLFFFFFQDTNGHVEDEEDVLVVENGESDESNRSSLKRKVEEEITLPEKKLKV